MSPSDDTALVTGASGFLGGRLVEMLAERGGMVRVLARGSSDLRHLSHLQIQIVRGDLGDAAALGEAMRGVRVVYHCAACSTDWAASATYIAANVAGTQNVLDAAVRAGSVERFLHVSTTDVYGYPRVPCDESTPTRDVRLPYNRTKIQGEEAVWRAHREHGLPVTVVRPATIFGPRGKDFVVEIAKLLRQRLMLLIDGGRARGGFTYVDNLAMAMIQAAENTSTLGRAYNISDGTGTTWGEYTNALADALGCKRPWLRLPFSAAMALAPGMEAVQRTLRLPGRPLLTRHAVHLLGQDQEFPAARARADFGFAPHVSFVEGMARSAAWVRSREPGGR
ncbi:MAG TPA: NAD-dependent epimerase/dehydratase family protein [Acidobacteriaceae bacterium]